MQRSPAVDVAQVEAALLSVLLSAENTRQGASTLLEALSPAFDDVPSALGVRGRDGLTLHVLAEHGTAHAWPTKLEPHFALGAQPDVDPASGALVVPLRAKGRVIGALLLAADRDAMAATMDETRDLLGTAAAVLDVFLSRMESELRRRAEALTSMDEIIEGLAHQISNPLTGASAIAQLLSEDLTEEEQRSSIAQIRHELGRVFVVLTDVLEFQRDTRAQDGILDLNAVVEKTTRFRGYATREMGIALHVETATTFLPVRADARGLEHAILTTLRFAERRASASRDRKIDVKVMPLANAEIGVRISDSSVGDVPDLSPAYFDLPFRADGSARGTRVVEKPDLGLVDSVLRGCGGRLVVESSPSASTLVIILPRAYTASTAEYRKPE